MRSASDADLVLLDSYSDRSDLVQECRRARRTSSFVLFICFASREILRCWYTEANHSCVGGASRIVSLITCMELNREIVKNCVCGNSGGFIGCFVS